MAHPKSNTINGIGITIPGYSIRKLAARGGMATVYQAVQESLDRVVALKIMSPTLAADPSIRRLFLQEGKIIAQLNHPNIVTVYDVGSIESMYYIIMEYISGGSLKDRLDRDEAIANPLDIVGQIANALAYAHERGCIHRDVKPANILFKEDGTAVLSDFGIAKTVSAKSHLTLLGFVVGTPDYMSPEQASGKPVDLRTDLYSLGIVMYELLARKKPFIGEDPISAAKLRLTAAIPKLQGQYAYCQPIIDRLMAKNPSNRFSSAKQCIDALVRLSTEATVLLAETHTRVMPSQSPKPTRTEPAKSARFFNLGAKTPAAAKKKRRIKPWKRTALLVSLLIVGSGTAWWIATQPFDLRTKWTIRMLLMKAHRHIEASQFTEPSGDNALETYREILRLEPDNKQALTGFRQIAEHLEQEAIAKRTQGRTEEALTLITLGLRIDPKHSGLLLLQDAFSRQLGDGHRQHYVAGLLAKANQQFQAARLIDPLGDNAYETFHQILIADPENKAAKHGYDKIAAQIVALARSEHRQGRSDKSLELLENALTVFQDHEDLIAIRTEITLQQEQQQKRLQVEELLTKANHQLNASKLTKPPEDNALSSLKAVLELDPANRRALAGFEAIARRCEEDAIKAEKNGQMEEAYATVTEGLKAVPKDSRLLRIHQRISKQLRETARREQLLNELLAKARSQMSASRYTQPESNNAYETFEQIIAIDADNDEAREGLKQIAQHFENNARIKVVNKEFEHSLTLVEEGLKAAPRHAGLLALREEATLRIRAEREQGNIDKWLARAKEQLKTGRLTEPEDDNAFAYYQKILDMAPGDERALAGIRRIAERYAQLARAQQQIGDLKETLALIEQGLRVAAEHQGLITLRDEVFLEVEERLKEDTIFALLAKGERQLIASRLTLPKGDNAYESYQKVLEMAPDDERALTGIRRIAERYGALGRSRRVRGELKESLTLIKKGLMIVPTDPDLLILKEQVQRELSEPQQKLGELLARAKLQLEAEKLTVPLGDNAYETYTRILEIDQKNTQASRGLHDIANRFLDAALSMRRDGDMQAAIAYAEKGLRVEPDHSELLSLIGEINSYLENRDQKQAELKRLLTKANSLLKAGKHYRPAGDNALETYKKVLQLDAENTRARKGIRRIVGHCETQARSEMQRGNLQQSLSIVNEGLKIRPNDTGLVSLQKQVMRMIRENDREPKQKEVEPRRKIFGTF